MRPVSVLAEGPGSETEQLQAGPHGRWRQATRAVMVLLSLHGSAPAQIAALPGCARSFTMTMKASSVVCMCGCE